MSWLESIIGFLNSNSGAITAIATVILVGITGWYVQLTKDMLKVSNTPVVILFLQDDGADIHLSVQNIGTGYASDIEFTGDLSFKPTFPGDRPLKETEPFKSGINYLGSEYKISVYMCRPHELKELPTHSFEIIVTYKDSTDAPHRKKFPFDVDSWENARQLIIPQREP